MGYEGVSFFDAGYFYCPFIPLLDEEPLLDLDEEPIYGAFLLDDEEQAYERMIDWLEEGF